jgi:DNA-binding SARP family transcriptional activator
MPTLQIRLLGDFQLLYQGELVTTVNQLRQQSLLAYLVLHHGVPQMRHHLAFLFWPDTTEVQALTNLRNLLHKLRQALPNPEHLLQADTQTIQWRPEISYTIDVVEFEATSSQAVTQAELEEAIQLYRGDLLPSCYDDWIIPAREQLRQRAIAALLRLLDLLEEARGYRAALGYGQQFNESACLDTSGR